MSDLLYHAYFPESHEFHVSQQEVMNSGIKYLRSQIIDIVMVEE